MKKFLAVASMLAAMAAVGSAAPTCASLISVNVLSASMATGCTVDGLLFSNFQLHNASGGTGIAEIDLTNVSIVGNDVILNFNPNLGAGTEGGTITDLHFAFTVTGPLLGADLNVGGNGASLSEQVCTMAQAQNVDGGCVNANTLFRASGLSGQAGQCLGNVSSGTISFATGGCNFGNGVGQAWVFKDISISDPATSHLTSFDESFFTAVPEPMTLSMMGVGLVGLGLISRRRKKS